MSSDGFGALESDLDIYHSCTHIRIHSVRAQFLFSQLEEILSCSLDPIRFCLEAVSREFVKVAPMLGLEW